MSKFCPQCGVQAADSANFCMKCGFDFRTLQSTNPAASSAPAPGPAASAAPVIAPVVPQKPVSATPWVQNTGVVNPNPVPGYETYNPTFHCRCEYCYFEFDYHTYDLGHRAWYQHGFVYCPRCQKPLRHKLEYEVLTNVQPAAPAPQPAMPQPPVVPPAPQA
ncbi:MAG: zinc ribbon domain-containing protein [Clostridiales bacterium]|nr:zinc ribbon domain-containing protein [Clostridiales bacterium]